jgi:hypothetical protein
MDKFGKKLRMSKVVKQPDYISFSGNLKKFEITSTTEVIFELKQVFPGDKPERLILSEKYTPDAGGNLTIDVKETIDRLLEIAIPGNLEIINESPTGSGDFFARIDSIAIPIRVIKGGVAELVGLTSDWLATRFLTWQPQEKRILQAQPEWLSIFPLTAGNIKLKAYYADNTSYTATYAALINEKLYNINTGWAAVSAFLAAAAQNSEAVAWDVWYEVAAVRTTPIQRYQLRNDGNEEHVYLWGNTLGGIDSTSFTGSCEEDEKLDHKMALYGDETVGEYDVEKLRETLQSTGYLNMAESAWLKDFFVSRNKYVIRDDGVMKPIAVLSSKVVSSSKDDKFDFEFTYRYAEDTRLLNLERSLTPLQAPEGLADFFLTELLSGLTSALYQDNLLMAVQNPYAQIWQKLTLAQLWGGALPTLVDGSTITFNDGKLKVIGVSHGTVEGSAGDSITWEELRIYIDSLTASGEVHDTRTELIGGAVVWKTGLTYTATDITYKILGAAYTAQGRDITLDAADPLLTRIDLFYVDSFGNIQVKKGEPAVNPATPVLDSSQLEVMSVIVNPGATSPVGMDVDIIYDEGAEWTLSETHETYTNIDFGATLEPVKGIKRVKVAISVPDSAENSPLHFIGEKYQGGVIFWLDATGHKGLISSENDAAINVFWESLSGHSVYTTGASGIEIGTGQANTAKMLASTAAKDGAVKFADELIIDIYDDWFLPSEKELDAMYFRRYAIGNFGNKMYWSSTEVTGQYNWKRARSINFGNGVADYWDKNRGFCVRAIRAFDDLLLQVNKPVAYYTPLNTKLTFASPVTVATKDGILSFSMKSSVAWRFNSTLLIETYLSGVKTGSMSLSPATSTSGYKTESSEWQFIAVRMSKFASNRDTFDAFRITLVGSWPNGIDLGFDDIRYQHTTIVTEGVVVTPGTYGSTKKSAVITINAQGVVTNIVEVDTLPVDEPLFGLVNGANRIFSTSVPYGLGTITVFVNGFKERNFTEYSQQQIELNEAPKNIGFTDMIEAIYIRKQI